MGYRAKVTQKVGDGGIDIIAHRDELGLQPPIIKVQVKSGQGSIGDPEVSQLYGKVDKGEVGLFVSLGAFTKAARAFEKSKSNLRLLDGYEFVELVLNHYDALDPKYKALFPLKRVFIPEPSGEAEGE
ncbi:MAG: restriction endonuclease [Thermodesulfobacteriota bacterium]